MIEAAPAEVRNTVDTPTSRSSNYLRRIGNGLRDVPYFIGGAISGSVVGAAFVAIMGGSSAVVPGGEGRPALLATAIGAGAIGAGLGLVLSRDRAK